MGKSDSESEEDAETSEVSFKCGPKEGGGGINSSCTSSLLGDSIWLFCGADGVRIWLPLDTTVVKRSMVEPSIPSSPSMEKRLQSNGGVYFPPLVHSIKASRRVMISLGLDGLSYPLGNVSDHLFMLFTFFPEVSNCLTETFCMNYQILLAQTPFWGCKYSIFADNFVAPLFILECFIFCCK